MPNQGDQVPIRGLTSQRLRGIARHLGLSCKQPQIDTTFDDPYYVWSCSGPITKEDIVSLVTFDFWGLDNDRINLIAVQMHQSPATQDFTFQCRRVVGFILTALDDPVAEQVTHWLDGSLKNHTVDKLEVNGVAFAIRINNHRTLAFDIHSAG